MRLPSAELSAFIQRKIDEIKAESLGEWIWRVCKEELNVLPIQSNLIYVWAIQPDGTVICLDHEAFGHPSETETDENVIYAAILNGADTYPELRELLPEDVK